MAYSILNKVNSPEDLRQFGLEDLSFLADELRAFVQETTKTKAGHIKSSLGVVELTIALHYVFNTPEDILIWDVGHQAYIHKVLTERKSKFHSNRQLGGISGFTKRDESVFDPFGAGHSSTSISAAVGFAESAKLKGNSRKHIAVIGDGALTGGESFEALNYLGERGLNVLVLVNDNDSSIDDNVGALGKYASYEKYCEALNINYGGLIDGHNIDALLTAFKRNKHFEGPQLIRVRTEKGKGWKEEATIVAEKQGLSFQEIFANKLEKAAAENDKIVAISPAMLAGSGLKNFESLYPDRTFDVGIAEQHAVTMAAAMAADGLIPVCHLYSTFAQRAYDQIIHDVALQNLPLVFCLDRAGLVGEDGATHHGTFDVGFLNTIPNLILSAAFDGASLEALLDQAIKSEKPFVIRYAKGGNFVKSDPLRLEVGKLRQLKKGLKKAIISYGSIGSEVEKALENLNYSHYDLVYLKPIDENAIKEIFSTYDEVITVEENSPAGGLGEVLASLKNKWSSSLKLRCLSLPDTFVEHGKRIELLRLLQLDSESLKKL